MLNNKIDILLVDKSTEHQDKIDFLPTSCRGKLDLCKEVDCSDVWPLGPRKKIIIHNKFGNIYANVIPAKGTIIKKSYKNLLKKDYYGAE